MNLRRTHSQAWATGVMLVAACVLCLVFVAAPVETFGQRATPQDLTWATAQLTVPLDSAAAVTVGNWLYVVGGRNSLAAPSDQVQRASIAADGSLGTWQATALPKALYGHTAVAIGSRIYVIGGYSGAYESAAYVATVGADGAPGGWQQIAGLPEGERRAAHAAVAADGYLYVLGGLRISDVLNTVYRARIRADGTLDAWTLTGTLPSPLYRHTAIVYNGAIYVIGGRPTTASVSRKIYRAAIQGDGALGAWAEVGSDLLPEGRADHASFVAGGKLYVAGGTDGSAAQAIVYAFQLGDTVTALPSPGSLPQARYRAAAVLSPPGYAYVAGGLDDADLQRDTIYFSQLVPFKLFLPLLLKDYTSPAPSVTVTRTPTSTGTATVTMTPTSTPTVSLTPTSTGTATVTMTSTSTPTVSPTPTKTSVPTLVFQGELAEPLMAPIGDFQDVELWGSNSFDSRTQRLDKATTAADGTFSLQTSDLSYSHYHLWLEPASGTSYVFISASPGAGGFVREARWIYYYSPLPGVHSGSKFVLQEVAVGRNISPPLLPTITLPTVAWPTLTLPVIVLPPTDLKSIFRR